MCDDGGAGGGFFGKRAGLALVFCPCETCAVNQLAKMCAWWCLSMVVLAGSAWAQPPAPQVSAPQGASYLVDAVLYVALAAGAVYAVARPSNRG